MDLERDVEKRLKDKIEAIGGLCLKFTSPSNRGVPDRVVLYKGVVVFVEVKKPDAELRPLQRSWKTKIESQGVYSRTASTKENVDALVNWIKRQGDSHEG